MRSTRVHVARGDSDIPGAKHNEQDDALMAISPIDGRYRNRTRALADYFSEYALIRYRVRVEIEWYLSLAANPAIDALKPIDDAATQRLRSLYKDFTLAGARRVKDVAMVARTHGQEASPTTVGKEFAIFVHRLVRQVGHLGRQDFLGKANGAVGNFNAHLFAYPEVDWIGHSRRFVESLGLVWNPLTTQIESHDFMAEMFDTMVRIDTILLGFARDIWGYIALGYFTQQLVADEVRSSVLH